MPPMLQDKVSWPFLLRPVHMDIPGGANPVPCAQPCSCMGRGKLSSAQWLKAILKTSPWGFWGLGLAACTQRQPEGLEGRPGKRWCIMPGEPGCWQGQCCPQAGDKNAPGTGCLSFLIAVQCVHGSCHKGGGTDGFDATTLC